MSEKTLSPSLLIVNASAGSGKTFNLVRNYLKLLLDTENETQMEHILAMTFTNKAALEMKSRIVKELFLCANVYEITNNNLIDLATFSKLKVEDVKRNSKFALKKMLHQYDDFNVLTIDKFNLRLIRSFARDLNLPEQFEILINEESILEESVDSILNTININTKNEVYFLAENFIQSALQEDNSLDIRSAIIESSKCLKNERFFNFLSNLETTDLKLADLVQLKERLKELKNELLQFRDKQIKYLHDFPLEDKIYSYQNDIEAIIKRIQQLTLKSSFEDFNNAFKISNRAFENINKRLDVPFSQLLLAGNQLWNNVNLAFELLYLQVNKFHHLAFLRILSLQMKELRERKAVIRISEFNQLIAHLIQEENAPYIYERIGTRYKHFFLDEFQDTSHLQWLNMVPLIHESISQGQFNFIVGDPKQSIYRFKNGIAEQFVALPRIYNPNEVPELETLSDFFESQSAILPLKENWRSAKEIVAFNNALFTHLKPEMPVQSQQNFLSILQEPKSEKTGFVYVDIELVTKDSSTFDVETDIDEEIEEVDNHSLNCLVNWTKEVLQDGFLPKDICVLSKTRGEANTYALHLKKHGFKVVSSDSLLIDSDPFVKLAICFLKFRLQPKNKTNQMRLAELFFRLIASGNSFDLFSQCFIEEVNVKNGKIENKKKYFSLQRFFDVSKVESTVFTKSFQSIFGLLQQFFRAMQISELDNAYLHQLAEIAYEFDLKNGPDLDLFLSMYNKEGKNTNVSLPKNDDTILLMTAHKSKGLEFPVVFIPNIDLCHDLKIRDNELIQKEEAFLLFRPKKEGIIDEDLKSVYFEEIESKISDGINLAYVALTRPEDRLYISGVYKIPKKPTKSWMDILMKSFFEMYPNNKTNDRFKLSLGEKAHYLQKEKTGIKTYHSGKISNTLWFPDISILSLDEAEQSTLNRQKMLGNYFHSCVENTQNEKEANAKLNQLIRSGKVDEDFSLEIKEMFSKMYSHPEIIRLYALGEHLDERTFALDDKTFLRPDKIIISDKKCIVIDFKTGEKRASHQAQLKQYVTCLKAVGYTEIDAFLYYSTNNELIALAKELF